MSVRLSHRLPRESTKRVPLKGWSEFRVLGFRVYGRGLGSALSLLDL